MSEPLSSLSLHARGIVVGFAGGAKNYRTKLLSMGLVKGTEFVITRIAPLGDPLELEIKGYRLSLRKEEARAVLVEKSA